MCLSAELVCKIQRICRFSGKCQLIRKGKKGPETKPILSIGGSMFIIN